MAAVDDLAVEDLDALIAALEAGGARSASLDPTKINTPGVWVRHDGATFDLLAGVTVHLTLHLIVAEQDPRRAYAALYALFNTLKPTIQQLGGPVESVALLGVRLPGSQTDLPALAVPLDLLTSQEV